MKEAKEKNAKLGLVITLIINAAVIAFVVIREAGSWSDSYEKISVYGIHPVYIAGGVLCFCAALFFNFLKYFDLIKVFTGKSDATAAYRTSVIGKYMDNVTPLGAGGQPFQISYLYKRGYSPGVSAAVPIICYITQQVAFVMIAAVIMIMSFAVDVIPFFRVSAVFGLLFYLMMPATILLFVIWPKPFRAAVSAVLRLLQKMRIIKDAEKKTESFCASLDEYVVSFRSVNKKPLAVVRLMLYSLIYQASVMAIPFFALKAFGSTVGFAEIFSMTVFIYSTITVVPTPGNSGAAEGAFYAVFSSLEGGPLFWAMILWRALVYYTWIILGVITYTRKAVKGESVAEPEKTEE